jgi:hypothetical protein
MLPIASEIGLNSAQFSFAIVDRRSSLVSYQVLTASGVFVLSNAGAYGADPRLEVPQVAKQYKNCELQLRSTAQVLIPISGITRQLSTGLAGLGYLSTAAQGLLIDGLPFQYAFAPGKDSVKLSSVPSVIDCTNVSAIFDFDCAFNNVSFPPDPAPVHSYQVLLFATLLLSN